MSAISPGILAGSLVTEAQQSDHDAGACRDCDPPPLASEPARIRNVVPVVPSSGDAQEHQPGDRPAEEPEQQRVPHQDPERTRLHRAEPAPGPAWPRDAELIGGRYRDVSAWTIVPRLARCVTPICRLGVDGGKRLRHALQRLAFGVDPDQPLDDASDAS